MSTVLNEPEHFLAALGGLHDVRVMCILLDPLKRTLAVRVDDLNSNFLGLPEYKGFQPATLYFYESSDVEFKIDSGNLSIYDARIELSSKGNQQLVLDFASGGYFSCQFKSAELDIA